MRAPVTLLMLSATLFAISSCQETSTTSDSAATSAAATTKAAVTPPAAPGAPAGVAAVAPAGGDLTATDKSMEVALSGDRHATIHYTDIKVGDGTIADAGKIAMVHYSGWLTDGTPFDSSVKRGQPFQFHLGAVPPEVIEGWDRGIRGMRVGGKRKLVIPPDLGYGARGMGGVIPPNATLVFEVELLGLQ